MAAIKASENGACVTLFEKKEIIGKKLLVTGNGRCNFTNMNMSSKFYYCEDSEKVDSVLSKFGNNDLISFFMSLGLLIKEKNGYVYPACEQASSVLDVLKISIKHNNINVITDCDISEIIPLNPGFELISSKGDRYHFDNIILSTGGRSSLLKGERANGYDILQKLGIKYSRLYPALTQIKCEGLNFKEISGVRQDCSITISVDNEPLMTQYGEVLFTDRGISGIVTFQLSHLAAQSVFEKKDVAVTLDFLPDLPKNKLLDFVKAKQLVYPEVTVEEFFMGFLNRKLNNEIIKVAGLKGDCALSKCNNDSLIKAFELMKKLELKVTGTEDFDKSQVTAGGVSLNLLSENFEVKSIPGLYITGELLDVDGLCGGYNLQWAFSTGYIAGCESAKRN